MARPTAVGTRPNRRKRVEPRIKWTSETPTGDDGRISKKENTKRLVQIVLQLGYLVHTEPEIPGTGAVPDHQR